MHLTMIVLQLNGAITDCKEHTDVGFGRTEVGRNLIEGFRLLFREKLAEDQGAAARFQVVNPSGPAGTVIRSRS